jgi:hypothetical protein
VEPPVQERALAEAGAGLNPQIVRRFRPAGAGDQNSLPGLAIDQEERQEVVSQRLVVEARNDGAADLVLGLGRGDRRAQTQQRRLAQGEVALALDRAGDRRGRQWGTLPSVVCARCTG